MCNCFTAHDVLLKKCTCSRDEGLSFSLVISEESTYSTIQPNSFFPIEVCTFRTSALYVNVVQFKCEGMFYSTKLGILNLVFKSWLRVVD